MTGLTLRTLTRWLTPWRTIRRLEAEVVRLKEQTDQRAQVSNELARMHGKQREELATAREALRRLMTHLMLRFDDITFVGVYRWYHGGMTGPLPPLPDHMVNYQPTTEDQP